MILRDLADGLVDAIIGDQSITVDGISADSRSVQPNFLFAALSGSTNDGSKFVQDALAKGAIAVLAETEIEGDFVSLVSGNPRLSLAKMAARFAGSQPATIAAVTGTAGKTSVVAFLRQIWEFEGKQSASLGTTGVVAKGLDLGGSLTTPDPVSLAKTMADLATRGVTHCAVEASSHGLDQYRLDGMNVAVAGFTNLGRDHMDYHSTVEEYLAAKMRLFADLLPKGGPAVIFADDEYSDAAFSAAKKAKCNILSVGRNGYFLGLKRVEHSRDGQIAEIDHDGVLHRINFPLAGGFQIANGLVAAGMAIATGTKADVALKALETLKGAPGRLEKVGNTEDGAPAYVDYAHKPEALDNVLQAVRPFTTGRVILVFGCGGDRDPGKREIMGEIAERLADVTIVTDDNPRTEDPSSIRAMALKGAPSALEIGDRAEAIHTAVSMMKEGDCLIVAGKGHENGQKIGDVEIPFLDHDHVRAGIKDRLSGGKASA